MSNALIVWQNIPESTKLVLVQGLTEKDLETVRNAAGKYVNSGDENDAVFEVQDLVDENDGRQDITELDPDSPVELKGIQIDVMVVCGFLL